MDMIFKQFYWISIPEWLRPKQVTKQDVFKTVVDGIADQLFTGKYEKRRFTSEEIATLMLDLKVEVRERLLTREQNHKTELEEATAHHTFEIKEAKKAYKRLK